MSEYGTVVNVQVITLGANVAADASAGATVVTVVDNVDLVVGGAVAIVNDDGTDGGLNVILDRTGEDTVTLATPLAADLPAGSRLNLSPVQKETRASVRLAAGGDPVRCVVRHSLADTFSLAEGIRDEDTAETVLLEKIDGEWQITDVAGQATLRRIIGGYIATTEDETAPRMVVLQDISGGVIQFWCGVDDESPGTLNPNPFGGDIPSVEFSSGVTPSAPAAPTLSLYSGVIGESQIQLDAYVISIIGDTYVTTSATTASGANVYIDPGTGQLFRVTSSLRYKQDVADAELDPAAVLALVPRRFRRKDEVATHGDEAPVYVGFIAEEAAGAGMGAFVRSDAEGPESFDYPMFAAVGHQAVLRAQQTLIEQMHAELDALKEQFAALTVEGGP